jgi:hypothetical protein
MMSCRGGPWQRSRRIIRFRVSAGFGQPAHRDGYGIARGKGRGQGFIQQPIDVAITFHASRTSRLQAIWHRILLRQLRRNELTPFIWQYNEGAFPDAGADALLN